MPPFAGNKHPSVHFFLHGPRLFHLSTEEVRVRSVGNGNQSDCSRADTLNDKIYKKWNKFSNKWIEKNTLEKWIKNIKKLHTNARKVHIYMWLHTASIESTVGNKTWLFPCPSLVTTGSFLIFDKQFRSDYVAACSTTLRSATEKNESCGYVAVPCRLKWNSVVAQRIGWNSSDVLRLVTTEHIRNKESLVTSSSVLVVRLMKTCWYRQSK